MRTKGSKISSFQNKFTHCHVFSFTCLYTKKTTTYNLTVCIRTRAFRKRTFEKVQKKRNIYSIKQKAGTDNFCGIFFHSYNYCCMTTRQYTDCHLNNKHFPPRVHKNGGYKGRCEWNSANVVDQPSGKQKKGMWNAACRKPWWINSSHDALAISQFPIRNFLRVSFCFVCG